MTICDHGITLKIYNLSSYSWWAIDWRYCKQRQDLILWTIGCLHLPIRPPPNSSETHDLFHAGFFIDCILTIDQTQCRQIQIRKVVRWICNCLWWPSSCCLPDGKPANINFYRQKAVKARRKSLRSSESCPARCKHLLPPRLIPWGVSEMKKTSFNTTISS